MTASSVRSRLRACAKGLAFGARNAIAAVGWPDSLFQRVTAIGWESAALEGIFSHTVKTRTSPAESCTGEPSCSVSDARDNSYGFAQSISGMTAAPAIFKSRTGA